MLTGKLLSVVINLATVIIQLLFTIEHMYIRTMTETCFYNSMNSVNPVKSLCSQWLTVGKLKFISKRVPVTILKRCLVLWLICPTIG